MAVFEFKALSAEGKQVRNLREAESVKALRNLLKKDGLFLTEVLGQSESQAAVAGGTRALAIANKDVDFKRLTRSGISGADVAILTRQLATLLKAGIPLVEALTALVDQAEKEDLKRMLSDVKTRVNEGSSFADALALHQKAFGNLYINMVRAGEHSGSLDSVLSRLAEFTEGQAKLKAEVIGALIYPFIMMGVGGLVLTLLMTVVVPKVTKVFADMKAVLPLSTRLLIFVSNSLQDYWFVLFPALGLGVAFFIRWARSPRGRPVWDRWILKAWVVGPMTRMLAVARFSRTLSTLLRSGVPLLTALDIVKNVMTNGVLASVIETARESIREGESIAAPLKKSGEFPSLVCHMIAVGERSGQLEEMLLNVAESYESQANIRIKSMTALLEPLMIVGMGSVVAFVAMAILLPILKMNSVLR